MDKYIESLKIDEAKKEREDKLSVKLHGGESLWFNALYGSSVSKQEARLERYKKFREIIKKYSIQKDTVYIDILLNTIFDTTKAMISKRRGYNDDDFLHIYYEILYQYIEENKDIVLGMLKANEEFFDILQKEHSLLNFERRLKDLKDCPLFFDIWQLAYGGLLSFGVKRENGEISSYWVEVSLEKAHFHKDENRICFNRSGAKGETLFYKTYKTREGAIKKISEILKANRMLNVEKDWKQKMSSKLKEIAGYKDNADGVDV
ncbi:hypothetical protein [Helicobacter labetoulli]|uniref:hypothetical protein n=1 Tax=Helicobacter labetoulli TaxID=2315333 RepID=UPI000EF67F5E|nr:hypothetical protein [Helicobacter labetoulli]